MNKGVQGLTNVAKRLPMPYELDDKFVSAIAGGVGRYFAEIGYTPAPTKPADTAPKTPIEATPTGG